MRIETPALDSRPGGRFCFLKSGKAVEGDHSTAVATAGIPESV